MHRMFAQQVDSKFLASLRKAELTVQSDHIGEDPSILTPVEKLQKLLRKFSAGFWETPVKRTAVEVIDSLVLVMKRLVQNSSSQALRLEHARYKRPEFHIAMIQLAGHGATKLYLDGLKTIQQKPVSFLVFGVILILLRASILVSTDRLAIPIPGFHLILCSCESSNKR